MNILWIEIESFILLISDELRKNQVSFYMGKWSGELNKYGVVLLDNFVYSSVVITFADGSSLSDQENLIFPKKIIEKYTFIYIVKINKDESVL